MLNRLKARHRNQRPVQPAATAGPTLSGRRTSSGDPPGPTFDAGPARARFTLRCRPVFRSRHAEPRIMSGAGCLLTAEPGTLGQSARPGAGTRSAPGTLVQSGSSRPAVSSGPTILYQETPTAPGHARAAPGFVLQQHQATSYFQNKTGKADWLRLRIGGGGLHCPYGPTRHRYI